MTGLRRTGPPARHTALCPGTGLERRTRLGPGDGPGLARTGGPTRHTPMPTGISPAQRTRAERWAGVRAQAWELAGGRCVLGGSLLPWHRAVGHHRLMRSQGGPDILANCLVLCVACHDAVHDAGDLAYDLGWLIRMDGDPEQVEPQRLAVAL